MDGIFKISYICRIISLVHAGTDRAAPLVNVRYRSVTTHLPASIAPNRLQNNTLNHEQFPFKGHTFSVFFPNICDSATDRK